MKSVTVPWFVRVAESTHVLLVPVCVSLVCFIPFLILDSSASYFVEFGMSVRQMLGTSLLFCVIPGYTVFANCHSWALSRRTVREFAQLIPASAQETAAAVTSRPGLWIIPAVLAGSLWGSDFSDLSWLANFANQTAYDLWLRLMAAIAWGFVFWLLCWRVKCSFALYRLGRQLEIDVYGLHGLSGFVLVPLIHLLIVVGGIALLPLQSLDFQIRWANYQAGLFIAAISLFLLVLPPILGLHQNMRDCIARRLQELQVEVDDCGRGDFSRLALLIEHRETVRSFTSWPLDIGFVGKLLFYLFIPPLAWVAAALVERAVDSAI